MKNNKPGNLKKPIPGFILPVVVILICVALIAIIYKKYSENRNYRVIKVRGVSTVSNLSKLELFEYSSLANDSACYAVVENGDLLSFDNVLYQVSQSTGDSLEVSIKEDSATYINGHLYTIIVNDKINLVPFLKSLNDAEIKSLVNLEFQTVIPKTYLPYLRKIASTNREVSLYFDDDSSSIILKDYFSNANYFNPKVFSGNITTTFYPQIAKLTNINTLFISINDSIPVPLPNLPNLKNCIILNSGDSGYSRLMDNNTSSNLVYPDTENFSNKDLKKFNNLQTLVIQSSDSAVFAGLDESLGHISTLFIFADSNGVSSELKRFSNVKWLCLDGNFPITSFTKTLKYFQHIGVLEIRENKILSSYKNLEEMPNLKALIIRDTVSDYNSLSSLKNLKYLSLPKNFYSDSTKLNSIKKALPGCIIAPNAGACLGSAWLLLIPVIAFFKFYSNRKILQPKIF
jgi:hypothetical protein